MFFTSFFSKKKSIINGIKKNLKNCRCETLEEGPLILGNIQIRGFYKNIPTQIILEWRTFIKISVKPVENSPLYNEKDYSHLTGLYGILNIKKDSKKIPKEKIPHDPWAANDIMRVFLGKGIFIESKGERHTEESLLFYNNIPVDIQNDIINALEKNNIWFFTIKSEQIDLWLWSGFFINTKRIIKDIFILLDLMFRINYFLEKNKEAYIPTTAEESKKKSQLKLVRCNYCNSHSPFTEKYKCPNCGAAYS
jgi:hypothetical protein